MRAKRVAVIGAGPSGLVTVKELLEQGHSVTCFERASGLGGVFRFDEHNGVVWDSCRLTSSGTITVFSDFPLSCQRHDHMTTSEYVRYLEDYCAAFDVDRHIRFLAPVQEVRKLADGCWTVQWLNSGRLVNEVFEAVAVCSGLHQHPYVPKFPGQEGYPGEIMHASQYRRGAQVAGKKVLVVGAGESGADIAAEASSNASETVMSLRRGVAVVPRRLFGKPRDYITSRIMNSAAHWVFQTRNPEDDHKRTIYRYAFLPLVILDKCLQMFQRLIWETLPLYASLRSEDVKVNLETRRLKQQLLNESGGTLHEQFGTKDDSFVRAIAMHKCRRVAAIDRFDGANVFFKDGSSFEPDTVLLCTGFETRVPFLEDRITLAKRYLNTFSPEVGDSLGFIGFLRPGFGAIPPLAELQARWFALLQSGVLTLPKQEEMEASAEKWKGLHKHVFRAMNERLGHLVDYTLFCDELAAQIGCKPTRRDLSKESRRFRLRFYAGPFVAAQYRLVGPNAKPAIARKVIETLPVTHPWPSLASLYIRWWLSRLLGKVMGPDYAPKLVIE